MPNFSLLAFKLRVEFELTDTHTNRWDIFPADPLLCSNHIDFSNPLARFARSQRLIKPSVFIQNQLFCFCIFVNRRPEKHTRDKFYNTLRVAPADYETSGKTANFSSTGSGDSVDEDSHPMFVSPSDLNKHRDRTNFYLRMSEVVQENSSQVALDHLNYSNIK